MIHTHDAHARFQLLMLKILSQTANPAELELE